MTINQWHCTLDDHTGHHVMYSIPKSGSWTQKWEMFQMLKWMLSSSPRDVCPSKWRAGLLPIERGPESRDRYPQKVQTLVSGAKLESEAAGWLPKASGICRIRAGRVTGVVDVSICRMKHVGRYECCRWFPLGRRHGVCRCIPRKISVVDNKVFIELRVTSPTTDQRYRPYDI